MLRNIFDKFEYYPDLYFYLNGVLEDTAKSDNIFETTGVSLRMS